MNKKLEWMNVHVNPFSDFDGFHCMEDDKTACDFCPHCGIDERLEISGHYGRNSYLFLCWWCPWVPEANKNYELCKGVIL